MGLLGILVGLSILPLANGVRKDALAPIATLITIGSADTRMSLAATNAIGIITSAVEVLEIRQQSSSAFFSVSSSLCSVVVFCRNRLSLCRDAMMRGALS